MYQVFLGELPLPIAPSSITTTINNRNETVDLIDGTQINILKKAGLTEISFSFLIPSQNYPFATALGSLVGKVGNLVGSTGSQPIYAAVKYFMLSYLEDLKKDKKPFQFIVVRMGDGSLLSKAVGAVNSSNTKVSLESYTIKEDAEEYGMDFCVEVVLKQYVPFSTKRLDDNGKIVRVRPS